METEKTTIEIERGTVHRTLLALQWLWVHARFAPGIGWEDQGVRVMNVVDELRSEMDLDDVDWDALHRQHEPPEGRNRL